MPNKSQAVKEVKKGRKRTKKNAKPASKRENGDSVGVDSKPLDGILTVQQQNRDARRQDPNNLSIELKSQQREIAVQTVLPVRNLESISLGYVTLALQRGWLSTGESSSYPYWAYIYMTKLLIAYAGNQNPPVTRLPYWLLCVCQALQAKKVPFQQGYATYSFTLDDPNYEPTSVSPVVGYASYGSQCSLHVPDPAGAVNKFPGSRAPLAYPVGDREGQAAFTSLTTYMNQVTKQGKRGKHPSDLVDMSLKTKYSDSVSAFGVTSSSEGLGYNNVGGWVSQTQLEVPIFDPIMALITTCRVTGTDYPGRFYNVVQTISGDGFWLANYLATLAKPMAFSIKRYTRFHAVDFLEFGSVIGCWVRNLLTAFQSDQETQTAVNTTIHSEAHRKKWEEVHAAAEQGLALPWPYYVTDPRCPLTLQEVLLLLRNVIMSAFKETQQGVQSLLPRVPAAGTANEFTPYVSGANCCPLDAGDMLLPIGMIENIRALVGRKVRCGSKHDLQWYVPVLGQYANDTLNSSDYTFPVISDQNGTVVDFNCFSDQVSFKKVVEDPKTRKSTVVGVAEEVISLIDGTFNSVPVFINDPNRLKALTSLWNGWLNTVVNSFSMTLGVLGTELGISSLTSIAMTRHWAIIVEPSKKQAVEDIRLTQKKILSGPYAARSAIAETSQSVIYSVPYEEVLSTWVLPTNLSDAGAAIGAQSKFSRWQALSGEPYFMTKSSGEDGISLAALHDVYATRMTKTRNGQPNQWDNFFKQESAKGRGGILSSLGAMIDGVIGI